MDEDFWDYGLYLLDQLLSNSYKSLKDWPDMSQVQQNWAAAVGNQLIARESDYNAEKEAQEAAGHIAQLTQDQRSASFDQILQAVETRCFFLHGPGGTGKIYVYNTLCHFLHGQGKIVLCVASSGIVSLLLQGGWTAHSTFKIPIAIHESFTYSINKNSDMTELIQTADLMIWNEAPMQHRHIQEAVDRTLRDIRNSDELFGGFSILFGGNFQQILPVIVKGSRPEIVGACIQKSYVWRPLDVLHLRKNMRLDVSVEQEREFVQWQLDVRHEKHTDGQDNVTLPESLLLKDNTITGLINYIYPNIGQLQPPLHQFFSERVMLSSWNVNMDEINKIILNQFPGEVREFHSADQVVNNSPEEEGEGELMYPVKYLNGINCSGLP